MGKVDDSLQIALKRTAYWPTLRSVFRWGGTTVPGLCGHLHGDTEVRRGCGGGGSIRNDKPTENREGNEAGHVGGWSIEEHLKEEEPSDPEVGLHSSAV